MRLEAKSRGPVLTSPQIVIRYRNVDSIETRIKTCPYTSQFKIEDFIDTMNQQLRIESLDLSNNQLKSINLDGIERLRHLKSLHINSNQLHHLDLNPLRYLTDLSNLSLDNNNLANIDLSPLVYCKRLHILTLLANPINTINLSPLLFLEDIDVVNLPRDVEVGNGSKSDSLPVKILFTFWNYAYPWKKPSWVKLLGPRFSFTQRDFKELIDSLGWDETRELMTTTIVQMKKEEQYPIQARVLEALGMGELCYEEIDLAEILELVEDISLTEESKVDLYGKLVDLASRRLQETWNTYRIDVERLRYSPGSKLIPIILKIRRQEVNDVRLVSEGNLVDISPLRETYYGKRILDTLTLSDLIEKRELYKIITELDNIGLKIEL